MSKWRAAPLELGKPHVAFFCSYVEFLASLVDMNKCQSLTVGSASFTDQGQVENVRKIATVEYVQEYVGGEFGEPTRSVLLIGLRHRGR